jgi:hypothetical protein
MNEILAQLIAAAIDADKIPGLECFDMTRRPRGQFEIVLNDTTRLRITVMDVSNSQHNASAMAPPPQRLPSTKDVPGG